MNDSRLPVRILYVGNKQQTGKKLVEELIRWNVCADSDNVSENKNCLFPFELILDEVQGNAAALKKLRLLSYHILLAAFDGNHQNDNNPNNIYPNNNSIDNNPNNIYSNNNLNSNNLNNIYSNNNSNFNDSDRQISDRIHCSDNGHSRKNISNRDIFDDEAAEITRLIDAVQADGMPLAILILGTLPEYEAAVPFYRRGADAYHFIPSTTPEILLWSIGKILTWNECYFANHRLQQISEQRRINDQEETEKILEHLWMLLPKEFQKFRFSERKDLLFRQSDSFTQNRTFFPDYQNENKQSELSELNERYEQILRDYIIMGAGTLKQELKELILLMLSGEMTTDDLLLLHLIKLEKILAGLGQRSSRHVMNRAELMLIELLKGF